MPKERLPHGLSESIAPHVEAIRKACRLENRRFRQEIEDLVVRMMRDADASRANGEKGGNADREIDEAFREAFGTSFFTEIGTDEANNLVGQAIDLKIADAEASDIGAWDWGSSSITPEQRETEHRYRVRALRARIKDVAKRHSGGDPAEYRRIYQRLDDRARRFARRGSDYLERLWPLPTGPGPEELDDE